MSMHDDILKVLVSEEELKAKVAELGAQISKDYEGKNLVLVSILKGSVVFMADLMRAVSIPCSIDFMVVSSYGGGNTISDQWAVKISESYSNQVRSVSQKYPGYQFIPGWFSWSNTIVLGKQVGATPNGRHAFEPINHGANPHPGFRKDGALTAMSNSICAVQPGYGNTAPVQLELDPGMGRGEEAVQKIADYIMTLFEQGATLLNINIVNGQQILEADKDPSKYPNLVVRVTGFTAYFCSLTPEFRKLVVDRILIQG